MILWSYTTLLLVVEHSGHHRRLEFIVNKSLPITAHSGHHRQLQHILDIIVSCSTFWTSSSVVAHSGHHRQL